MKKSWLRRLLHIHLPREVFRAGVYSYQECRCGERHARRIQSQGFSAVETGWLDGGKQTIASEHHAGLGTGHIEGRRGR